MTERAPTTHDFGPGRRGWGHDYTITQVIDRGARLRVSGWGHDGLAPIEAGDYLLLDRDGKRSTRYQVDSIQREMDPPDMWHARLVFAPRTAAAAKEDSTG